MIFVWSIYFSGYSISNIVFVLVFSYKLIFPFCHKSVDSIKLTAVIIMCEPLITAILLKILKGRDTTTCFGLFLTDFHDIA